MSFGARLTAARKKKGLTQDGLGKGLGTDGKDASKAVVYGWEKDQHYPRVDQLALICEKLDESADYLLTGRRSVGTLPADLADLVAAIQALPPRHREFVMTTARDAMNALDVLQRERAANGLGAQPSPEASSSDTEKRNVKRG